MTKLKKQVARLKINHFLNNNKYILFYPSSSISAPYKSAFSKFIKPNDYAIGFNFNKSSTFKSVNIHHQDLDGYRATILFVKNKIAQKAVSLNQRCLAPLPERPLGASIQYQNYFNKTSRKQRTFTRIVTDDAVPNKTIIGGQAWKAFIPSPELDLGELCAVDKLALRGDCTFEKSTEISYAAIFQGNMILLGCNNLITLEKILEIYNQPVGGLYNTSVLDHFQLQRLAELSKGKQSYQKLISCIKIPSVNILFSLKDRFSLLFLLIRQIELLRILQIRSHQLSKVVNTTGTFTPPAPDL